MRVSRRWCGATRLPETPRVLSVGDLRFDLDTLEAERGGERAQAESDDAPAADRPAAELASRGDAPGTGARAVGRLAAAGRLPARAHARAAHGDRQEFSGQAPAHDPWHRLSTFGRTGSFVGLNDWFSRLSLRARIAGTMIALVASRRPGAQRVGLPRRRTAEAQHHARPAVGGAHALRAAHARRPRRRAAALGAPEHLSVQRPGRAAATHRDAQARGDASRALRAAGCSTCWCATAISAACTSRTTSRPMRRRMRSRCWCWRSA